LEGGVGDSRLPLVLRNLEEETGGQEALSLKEAVSKAKVAENGLINGENSIPNGTRSENENLNPEERKRVIEDAKESSDSTDKVKEQL
jgi:histone-lysine N-methyltransferase SETD3